VETPQSNIPPDDASRAPSTEPELFSSEADPAHESLTKALRSSFNVLRLIMLGLVVLYLFSGFFKLQSGEQGLISRLGKLRRTAQGSAVFREGLHICWPDPFDEKIRLSGQIKTLNVNSFLFEPRDASLPVSDWEPVSSLLRPGYDGALLTGDRNLSHAHWKIEYGIRKPSGSSEGGARDFVTNVASQLGQAEKLLLRLTENAVVRTVASRSVDEVLRGGGAAIGSAVKDHVQSELNRLETGIFITKVTPITLEPRPVRGLTDFITQAANEKKRIEEDARKAQAEILNRAAGVQYKSLLNLIDRYGAAQTAGADQARLDEMRAAIDAALELAGGEVARIIQQAQSQKTAIYEQAQRDYEEFSAHLANYRRDPIATKLTMWTDMRKRVHSSIQNEVFFLPNTGTEIIISRDPHRAIKAQEERVRNMSDAPRRP
jgi:regulator of protease activity HflC (stomatin/prohibitin superfamily)